MNKTNLSVLIAGTLLVAAPAGALAAEGDWLFRAGMSQVAPKDDNLRLAPNVVLGVDNDERFTFDITYMIRDNWGLELLAADTFNHGFEVYENNTAPPVLGGSVEHIPPTLSVQYHFMPDSRFRPYVGAGVNYTLFSNEKPSGLKLDDSFGPAFQAGIDVGINDSWFVNYAIRWIDIDADATLGGDKLGTIEIDPWVYSLNLGYRFGRPAPAVAAAPAAAPPPPPPPEPAPPPPPPPADTDGDGVPDTLDRCPTTPVGVRVDSYGCSCDYTLSLSFGFDSAELTPEDKALLDELIPVLEALPQVRGVIEGHTDSRGPEAYNQQLSERRANAVKEYLDDAGIIGARFTTVGLGESQPVASNETEEGRAANRRVVFKRTDCN